MEIKNQKGGDNSVQIQIENVYIDSSTPTKDGELANDFGCNLYQLCYNVLLFIQAHNMKIDEDEFKNICGEQVDSVLVELKSKNIGSFIYGYKAIWSINQNQLHLGLNYYRGKI